MKRENWWRRRGTKGMISRYLRYMQSTIKHFLIKWFIDYCSSLSYAYLYSLFFFPIFSFFSFVSTCQAFVISTIVLWNKSGTEYSFTYICSRCHQKYISSYIYSSNIIWLKFVTEISGSYFTLNNII